MQTRTVKTSNNQSGMVPENQKQRKTTMSTELTQVPGAAAAQTPTNPPPAAQPAAEQPKTDTPANPATPAAPAAPAAPEEPAPAAETSFFEEETLGLSNRTWCEIIGGIAVAAAGYFVGQYMAKSDDAAPAV